VRGWKAIATLVSLAALAAPAGAEAASTGGVAPGSATGSKGTQAPTGPTGGSQYTSLPTPARLENGVAYAPPGAPVAVVRAIRAGNKLQNKPYRYGGGHRSFRSSGYDCSGAVSYALHGGRLLRAPLDSTSLMSWGVAGPGSWITVYANPAHTYVAIAGLRLDTSGTGGSGPRWQLDQRDPSNFVARHPRGL
jgi:cell wall-associated NlpC family hydrolase